MAHHVDIIPCRSARFILILGFFKYLGFFVTSFVAVLESFGLQANIPVLKLILPVGISFYTFQTMAYTIDVYRRRVEPVREFVVFALQSISIIGKEKISSFGVTSSSIQSIFGVVHADSSRSLMRGASSQSAHPGRFSTWSQEAVVGRLIV